MLTAGPVSVIPARRPLPSSRTTAETRSQTMSYCLRNVVSSSRRTQRLLQSGASRKTATCSTPSSRCMKSHRRTTTSNSQKQTSLLRSRRPRQKPKSWALSSSRQTVSRAHECPCLPLCEALCALFAGRAESLPHLGLPRRIWPDFGQGFRMEAAGNEERGTKSRRNPWRFCAPGQSHPPAVRAVSGIWSWRCFGQPALGLALFL